MGRGIPQGHDTKIPRHSASFMGHRTEWKFIVHLFLRLKISTLCMENKVLKIAFSLQVIRSFNIMMKEMWFPSKKIDKQDTLVPCVLK